MQHDFKNKIEKLAEKIQSEKELVKSEADTESVFVEPFLEILGYKVSDARTLKRQYPADFGKKGNDTKVDYAILSGDKPLVIIEAKHHSAKLDNCVGQLKLYFAACIKTCHFGILTNGIEYYFFSNIESEKEMDEKPFFTINLEQSVNEKNIKLLKMFVKSEVKPSEIKKKIKENYIIEQIENKISKEIKEPSDEFVRLFKEISGKQNLQGKTKKDFIQSIKQAFENVIDDLVQNKMKEAQNTSMKFDKINQTKSVKDK